MDFAITQLSFAPRLPVELVAALGAAAALLALLALWRRARGAWLRTAVLALMLLAILNPRLVEETRAPLSDIAVLLVDDSASIGAGAPRGERARQIAQARARLEERLRRFPDLEFRIALAPEAGTQGTRLFEALSRALADIPRGRLAGVLALTDGQVHDLPAELDAATGGAPFHVLLAGRRGETDRRVRVVEAPSFGIVGRTVELRVIVEDLGGEPASSARLVGRQDGTAFRDAPVPVGREQRIEVPVPRAGASVIEFEVEPRAGEVSQLNNRAIITLNGVRDRLRVLLVSGEPHAGQRTWRRLLKADPAVDLVHFTILRPPEKDDLTPLNELALIAFPTRELFVQRIRDFDLIIMDRFQNRGILPPLYLRNIADYVRNGGALLMSAGPEFVGNQSLYNTPLGAILPGAPTGRVAETLFRPRVSDVGFRHPVTEGLAGANAPAPSSAAAPAATAPGVPPAAPALAPTAAPTAAPAADPSWGRWFRRIELANARGHPVMEAENGAPLLLLDRAGQGRVALLASDQIWLWSRNYDGGGPQAELLRRLAHWLMKEPDLEEEDLRAHVEGGRLMVERRSLDAGPPPEITVTAPEDASGELRAPAEREQRITLAPRGGGRSGGSVVADVPGVWRVTDGQRVALAAAGMPNPPEIADLRASPEILQPAARASGGAVMWLADAGVPELRRVPAGRDAWGANWLGLRQNRDHVVTGVAELPLLPPWLALMLIGGLLVWTWRREGR
ncbi:MAG: hypothetical protein IT557_10425 [Alphaproteobacteria bacterium]|nr:hypothetical protein [Alphaproteobacteria bacterium]